MPEGATDIGGQKPKVLTSAMAARSHVMVTMGCLEVCPLAPLERTMEWGVQDPAGQPVEKFRETRDDVRRKDAGEEGERCREPSRCRYFYIGPAG
ncbi:MAG: hypothetical protein PHU95_07865 [Candidatus Thermoplasmatota archaeon]|nr:hypothetical protein [Candidatus Thermoplasmatota archaeon]